MALFTDQNVSDISDLIAYEANLPEIAGTIFQDTRKPLRLWFRAIWHVTSQKNGVSAREQKELTSRRR